VTGKSRRARRNSERAPVKLVVTTPTAVALDVETVRYVRAEDQSGAFGIQPGHADFLTTLVICVVRWRDGGGHEHYVAVRGGVLRVRGGRLVEIATRQAVVNDTLGHLFSEVLVAMRNNLEMERSARSGALRLEHAAIRQIYRYLRPSEQPLKAERTK
jgi:F-type H+-transporting ATPase subunit epsilon